MPWPPSWLPAGGNRRALFAALDALLGKDALGGAGTSLFPAAQARRPFALRRLALENWKVFHRVELAFPKYDPKRPVVLIGGENGFGKTSILEAVIFGLYGQRALIDVDKALRFGPEELSRTRRRGYLSFIESAFHSPARDAGEAMMAIELTFDTEDGPLSVTRRWHPDAEGMLCAEDEELALHVGQDGEVLDVPSDLDPMEFYQEEISRRLLPPALSPFFIFNGEQVSRLADRQLSEQLRLGVDSVLGLGGLRHCMADLRDYSRDRAKAGTPSSAPEDLARRREEEVLRAREAAAVLRAAELGRLIVPVRARRDAIFAELGALSGGSYADLQELLELRRQKEADVDRLGQEISAAVSTDLPFILAGQGLRESVRRELAADAAGEASSGAARSDEASLAALLKAFRDERPALKPSTLAQMEARIRAAWMTAGSSPEERTSRHPYLSGRSREGVISCLSAAEEDGGAALTALISQQRARQREVSELSRGIHDRNGAGERREALSAELLSVSSEAEKLDEDRSACDRELGETQGALDRLRQKAIIGARASVDGAGAVAEAASGLADLLGVIVGQVAPLYFGRFANAVTRSYKALAHKGVVAEIRVAPEGRVSILARDGADIWSLEPSAGESQILAMAMMAAVSELAGCGIPLLVDTPLGRLDTLHRQSVLEWLASRPGQTILLSQPEEISGGFLRQIQGRVSASYLLEHEESAMGLGESMTRDGYFAQAVA